MSNPPLPVFDGVPAPSPGGGTFSISQEDQEKYNRIFASTDMDGDGYVTGSEAVALFTKSGLDKGTLKAIWSMSDIDKDNRLDHAEFSVAMHLVVSLSKRGKTLPPTLPPELLPPGKSLGVGNLPAPPQPIQPQPEASSFKSMSLDDALSSASIDIGLPVIRPTPQEPQVPPPTTTTFQTDPLVVPAAPPAVALQPPAMSTAAPPSLPPSAPTPYASFYAETAPKEAAAPPPAGPSTVVFTDTHSSQQQQFAGGATQNHPLLSTVAADLELAMSSQIKRENVLLEGKRDLVSAAAGDLKRLEQERNVFLGRVERLKHSCAEEDAEFAQLGAKIEAMRRELGSLRGEEVKLSGEFQEKAVRKVETRGVLATLVAAVMAEGGRAEGIEGELRGLAERAWGKELAAQSCRTAGAELGGLAGQHNTASEGLEEGITALRQALSAAQVRTRALEQEKVSLEENLIAAGIKYESASQELQAAEKKLVAAKARHMERCVCVCFEFSSPLCSRAFFLLT